MKNNTIAAITIRLSSFTVALSLVSLWLAISAIMLVTPIKVNAASDLSRSFTTNEVIQPGSLTSVDKNKQGTILLANTSNEEQLVGVAVSGGNSLLAVNSGTNKVQVAVSGQVSTLVTNIEGDINAGDMISVTPFTGIGAKAHPGDHVVGIAQTSFNAKSKTLKTVSVTDLNGKTQDLKIGSIPVIISVGVMANTGSIYGINSNLQNFATNIAGQPVSLVRIAICLVIGLVAIVSLVVIVYSTIRNGIKAVSRNPLAKPAIFDSMAQVMVMVAFIAVVSIVIMYAVLKI